MRYDTRAYHVKPVVPRAVSTVPFRNRICEYIDFLSDELFEESLFYYLKNDSEFRQAVLSFLDDSEKYCWSQSFKERYSSQSMELLVLTKQLEDFKEYVYSERRPTTQIHRMVSKNKIVKIWNRQLFIQRKRAIKKYYPKKKYPEMNELLTVCNQFIRYLITYSMETDQSLDVFVSVGQTIDWFLLSLTECEFHQMSEFRELFQSTIRVQNDLVKLFGILNVLMQEGSLIVLCSNESPISLESYQEQFKGVLDSAIQIIVLYEKGEECARQLERERQQREIRTTKEVRARELLTMHEIAVDRKIQPIKKINDRGGECEKDSERFNG